MIPSLRPAAVSRSVVGLCCLAAGACADGTGPGAAGWLRADLSYVEAPSPRIYEGNAIFSQGTDELRRRDWFSLTSTTDRTVEGAEETIESILIYRLGAKRPPLGEYSVGLLDQSQPAAEGLTLLYESTAEGMSRFFAAESGVISVRLSNSSMVSGTFEVVVAEYCRIIQSPPSGSCQTPWGPAEDAPRIEVAGSFVAVPDDDDFNLLGVGPPIVE